MLRWSFAAALAGIVLLAVVLPVAAGDDWPQFRGPTGDGHSDATGVPLVWSETENVRWKTAIHDRGWSSPVVLGKQIWLTTATSDGKQMFALCLDLESGQVLHDIKLFENEKTSPIHDTNSYASPTPVIEAGRVYITFGSYGTACLDTATGKVLWQRRDLECEHWRGPGSSPILYDNLLIMNFDGYDYQYIVALNKATGETVWKTDRDVDFHTDNGDMKKAFSTPQVIMVDGQPQVISSCAAAALAYEPLTGKEIWRVTFKQHSATARPLFGYGMVFINTGFSSAEMLAVRPGAGDLTDKIVWKVTKLVGSKTSSVMIGERIYSVHDNTGVCSCLNALTGDVVWSKRLGGNFSASPILVDGRLYFSNDAGTTTVLKPGDSFEQLAQNKLSDGCMASPAVVGKAILLRTKSDLYRLEQAETK